MQTARPPKERMPAVNGYPGQKPTEKTTMKTRIYDFCTTNRTELLTIIDLCSEIDRTTGGAHAAHTRVKLAKRNAKNGRPTGIDDDNRCNDYRSCSFSYNRSKILAHARSIAIRLIYSDRAVFPFSFYFPYTTRWDVLVPSTRFSYAPYFFIRLSDILLDTSSSIVISVQLISCVASVFARVRVISSTRHRKSFRSSPTDRPRCTTIEHCFTIGKRTIFNNNNDRIIRDKRYYNRY